jgi:hypothetical protein
MSIPCQLHSLQRCRPSPHKIVIHGNDVTAGHIVIARSLQNNNYKITKNEQLINQKIDHYI